MIASGTWLLLNFGPLPWFKETSESLDRLTRIAAEHQMSIQANTDSIKDLKSAIRDDHDLLVRYVGQREQERQSDRDRDRNRNRRTDPPAKKPWWKWDD